METFRVVLSLTLSLLDNSPAHSFRGAINRKALCMMQGPAQANDLLRRLQTRAHEKHADEYLRKGLPGGKFNRRC